MPYSDAILLSNELEQNGPPVRMLFARFVGYEPPKRFTGKQMSPDDFVMAQKIMGAALPMPPQLKAALLWAEDLKKKHPGL